MTVKDLIKKLQTIDEDLVVTGQINERVPGTACYTGSTTKKIEVKYKFGSCVISLYDR